ncbi:hypothetical protein ACFQY4_06550 [Catellatospora bangladeshensis]|uniref:Uncharacterized protein n=1 Tax=Catellatospora bangladeshensis TaxID=310355 RepID=A0A8J3NL44_9ACTN|nr:hypothetical protein [Catellatospora bangladeshensis]GIF85120.1 hypothetical protein Cba03nite_64690 [Catellatospora bangladeshensis]
MKLRAVLCAAVLAATATAIGLEPAAAAPAPPAARAGLAPTASAHPSRGLDAYTYVIVKGSGLPPSTPIRVVQCDQPSYQVDGDVLGCPVLRTGSTDGAGSYNDSFNPFPLVYRSLEYGDPVPVYCRADICRYFLEWTDAVTGELHSVPSGLLYFVGAPATVALSQSAGLVDGQQVIVTGSAKGSQGRYVTIVQARCYQLVQGSGCSGQLPLVSVPLRDNDTFRVKVPVYRHLADLTDCRDEFFPCRLIAVVLDTDGRPDDTFGVSSLGDPGVVVTFAP